MPCSLDCFPGMRGKIYLGLSELSSEGRDEFSDTSLWEMGVRPCMCPEALLNAVEGPASILFTDLNARHVH